ncbi:Hypothetical protein LUCI_4283 [Lucifera butyrica]|uniref:Bacteriophage N4 adsorption protein B n=1 Tax=Lucifera butyrica TaxID=1351585 RepID=A0A498RDJ9_9FIRM|nr:hypothetical protein [Lucifera butyrica]VBB08997.1 Hypothetical protein LUCI_4283 [Lucifera butyrica]
MFNQYFGQYLLNKELLTVEQLRDILNRERSIRPRLGLLAMDSGLMTAAQVEQVHSLQHVMDKKFGEIAVEKGFLTVQQLEELLLAQENRRLTISQAIIDSGYLSLSQLETALENYKRETGLTGCRQDAQYEDWDAMVRTSLNFSATGASAGLLYDYVALLLRIIPRTFGEEPVIAPLKAPVKGRLFSQTMTGNITLSTGLVMDNTLLLELSRYYSGETIPTVNELALDSIAEFLNETNGIFTVNMSERNLELNLEPQRISPEGTLPAKDAYRIPIEISRGTIDLYIVTGNEIA